MDIPCIKENNCRLVVIGRDVSMNDMSPAQLTAI